MPVYEYICNHNDCGQYEVWRTIDARESNTECPKCGEEGRRIYSPPMTLTSKFRLKVESKEPTVISKKRVQETSEAKPRLRQSPDRPWMLNRGC
jgi:putative FmdB family regulatory protein